KAGQVGAMTCIHAENGDLVDIMVREKVAAGQTTPLDHALSRPPEVEAEATGRAISFAEIAQAPVYIVHLTSAHALKKVKDARDDGQPVFAETCPQYLLLSQDNNKERDFEGAKYVMSPPLREKWHQDVLWTGLASGDLQVVSTDHAPFRFKGQKDMFSTTDFSKIPNGAPGIETRLYLLYTKGYLEGWFDENRFVELVSASPAKLFGLFPRKGTIAVGSDADLVIWDPKAKHTLRQATLHQRCDYTPYEGWKVTGRPVVVMSRGKVVVEGDQFVGKAGDGQFLKRSPVWF
ncbi:MAG: amidohydrolase family protein, partial [Chloroflexota bacterium]|nr:amidohydrolase family protein [Chloroflexota bacterium]